MASKQFDVLKENENGAQKPVKCSVTLMEVTKDSIIRNRWGDIMFAVYMKCTDEAGITHKIDLILDVITVKDLLKRQTPYFDVFNERSRERTAIKSELYKERDLDNRKCRKGVFRQENGIIFHVVSLTSDDVGFFSETSGMNLFGQMTRAFFKLFLNNWAHIIPRDVKFIDYTLREYLPYQFTLVYCGITSEKTRRQHTAYVGENELLCHKAVEEDILWSKIFKQADGTIIKGNKTKACLGSNTYLAVLQLT